MARQQVRSAELNVVVESELGMPVTVDPDSYPGAARSAGVASSDRLNELGELVLELAHEINQPVAAAGNFARACLHWKSPQGDALPEEVVRLIEKMVRQTDRAAEIVKRLSACVSRGPRQKTLSDLNGLVEDAVSVVRSCFSDGNQVASPVDFNVELTAGLPFVEVDPIQIEQVLVNLLRNAVEASRDAASPAPVVVSTERCGTMLQVAVRDSGDGVAPHAASQLFEPFFTTKSDGMGLGLSISRSIVQSHGGALWAESNAKRGTTFYFTLPLSG
jgi:two-component system, LuxR family, sensor kinase FixL